MKSHGVKYYPISNFSRKGELVNIYKSLVNSFSYDNLPKLTINDILTNPFIFKVILEFAVTFGSGNV